MKSKKPRILKLNEKSMKIKKYSALFTILSIFLLGFFCNPLLVLSDQQTTDASMVIDYIEYSNSNKDQIAGASNSMTYQLTSDELGVAIASKNDQNWLANTVKPILDTIVPGWDQTAAAQGNTDSDKIQNYIKANPINILKDLSYDVSAGKTSESFIKPSVLTFSEEYDLDYTVTYMEQYPDEFNNLVMGNSSKLRSITPAESKAFEEYNPEMYTKLKDFQPNASDGTLKIFSYVEGSFLGAAQFFNVFAKNVTTGATLEGNVATENFNGTNSIGTTAEDGAGDDNYTDYAYFQNINSIQPSSFQQAHVKLVTGKSVKVDVSSDGRPTVQGSTQTTPVVLDSSKLTDGKANSGIYSEGETSQYVDGSQYYIDIDKEMSEMTLKSIKLAKMPAAAVFTEENSENGTTAVNSNGVKMIRPQDGTDGLIDVTDCTTKTIVIQLDESFFTKNNNGSLKIKGLHKPDVDHTEQNVFIIVNMHTGDTTFTNTHKINIEYDDGSTHTATDQTNFENNTLMWSFLYNDGTAAAESEESVASDITAYDGKISIENDWQGTILAPEATFENHSQMMGGVIVKDYEGASGTSNRWDWQGYVSPFEELKIVKFDTDTKQPVGMSQSYGDPTIPDGYEALAANELDGMSFDIVQYAMDDANHDGIYDTTGKAVNTGQVPKLSDGTTLDTNSASQLLDTTITNPYCVRWIHIEQKGTRVTVTIHRANMKTQSYDVVQKYTLNAADGSSSESLIGAWTIPLASEYRYVVTESSPPHGYLLSKQAIIDNKTSLTGVVQDGANNLKENNEFIVNKDGDISDVSGKPLTDWSKAFENGNALDDNYKSSASEDALYSSGNTVYFQKFDSKMELGFDKLNKLTAQEIEPKDDAVNNFSSGPKLNDMVFKVERYSDVDHKTLIDTEIISQVDGKVEINGKEATNNSWKIPVPGDGYYRVTETSPPQGYVLGKGHLIEFAVEKGVILDVSGNQKEFLDENNYTDIKKTDFINNNSDYLYVYNAVTEVAEDTNEPIAFNIIPTFQVADDPNFVIEKLDGNTGKPVALNDSNQNSNYYMATKSLNNMAYTITNKNTNEVITLKEIPKQTINNDKISGDYEVDMTDTLPGSNTTETTFLNCWQIPLAEGEYTIQETAAPDGDGSTKYEIDSKPVEIIVNKSGQATVESAGNNKDTVIDNEQSNQVNVFQKYDNPVKTQTNFVFRKFDGESKKEVSDDKLKTLQFKLIRYTDATFKTLATTEGEGTKIISAVKDPDGTYRISTSVEQGYYAIYESKAPAGYDISGDSKFYIGIANQKVVQYDLAENNAISEKKIEDWQSRM